MEGDLTDATAKGLQRIAEPSDADLAGAVRSAIWRERHRAIHEEVAQWRWGPVRTNGHGFLEQDIVPVEHRDPSRPDFHPHMVGHRPEGDLIALDPQHQIVGAGRDPHLEPRAFVFQDREDHGEALMGGVSQGGLRRVGHIRGGKQRDRGASCIGHQE